ncbi:hypothetical protein BH11PLA1_BH11PLA1_24160 [soil metagenome]
MTALSANSPGVAAGARVPEGERRRGDPRFYKFVVALNCAVPGGVLIYDALMGQLGVNAVNFAIRTTGLLALIFLLLSLTVTPIIRVSGWTWIGGHRRWLGLFAFFYGAAHFGIFFFWDRSASVSSTIEELLARTYLIYGSVAMLLMAPLAATSFDAAVRVLGGKKWKLLHRLAYFAAISGALHYFLLVKADTRQPLVFAGILGLLLVARLVYHEIDLTRAARGMGRGGKGRAGGAAGSVARGAPALKKFWSGEMAVAATFDETPSVRTFRMTPAAGGELPFMYLPGQYLTIELNVEGKAVRRSYTIASTPTKRAYIEITVKREERGVSSGHLHRAVMAGHRVKISAPAGKFVFIGEGERGVVMVAGGVGITPLMSMVRALTDRSWGGEIFFVVVARNEAEIIFRDELAVLAKRFANLKVLVTLTQPTEAWSGARGRLTVEMLRGFVPGAALLPVYVCGPDAMMAAACAIARDLGVPDERVHVEAFVSNTSMVDEPAAGAARAGGGALAENATVTFARSGKTAELTPEVTVLEASEEAGVNLPYECRAGTCGTCKVRLRSGEVRMEVRDALTAKEEAGGFILACQAKAVSDLEIEG